jgi:hypothetical protein
MGPQALTSPRSFPGRPGPRELVPKLYQKSKTLCRCNVSYYCNTQTSCHYATYSFVFHD